jgi:DNA-binding MarR family transcriptional regulator
MTPPVPNPDVIDRFLDEALRLFPEVDAETEGLVDRIHKINKHIDRLTERTVREFGLNAGEFRVLIKLRWAPDGQMSAGELAERLDLSTGAMTNRLDGLERTGLIARERSTTDRRSVKVSLTSEGESTLAKAVTAQAHEEKAFTDALTAEQKKRLNALLRTLVLSLEHAKSESLAS